MKLSKSFFLNDDVVQVAQELIGKRLCTYINNDFTAGVIVETEAYSHLEKACHAFNKKRTKRTETLFMEGGTAYVYLCYGIHKLFNVVTNNEEEAEAVLIRAVEPVDGIDIMLERRGMSGINKNLTSGPGKLTQALGIDMVHDKTDLLSGLIWVESGEQYAKEEIEASCRIGVSYAKEDALLPWRFSVKNNIWVSSGNNNYNF